MKGEVCTVAGDLVKLRKKKKKRTRQRTVYNVTGTDEDSTGPVDELFRFIGSDPNKAVSRSTGISIL